MSLGRHSALAQISEGGSTVVEVRRLDDLRLPAPDFIKIDVEGHELEMLKGAERTLRDKRPGLMIENRLSAQDTAATLAPLRFLESCGYALYLPVSQTEVDGTPALWREAKPGQAHVRLGLVPLPSERRLLLREDLNLIAWPVDRGEALRAVFSP
jgi:hypothetical protein